MSLQARVSPQPRKTPPCAGTEDHPAKAAPRSTVCPTALSARWPARLTDSSFTAPLALGPLLPDLPSSNLTQRESLRLHTWITAAASLLACLIPETAPLPSLSAHTPHYRFHSLSPNFLFSIAFHPKFPPWLSRSFICCSPLVFFFFFLIIFTGEHFYWF